MINGRQIYHLQFTFKLNYCRQEGHPLHIQCTQQIRTLRKTLSTVLARGDCDGDVKTHNVLYIYTGHICQLSDYNFRIMALYLEIP